MTPQLSETEFIQIISKNQGIIHKVCNMYCNDVDDRKDLFQEIVIQLWKSYNTFRGDAKFTTWIYRVALNIAISAYRKESRRPEKTDLEDISFKIAEEVQDPEKEAKFRLLEDSIKQLSEIERAIVMMYLDEYSSEEIAETVGITSNNVRVRMNRIKEKLRKMMTPHLVKE
ncbi:MAG: RNA polymerase sigma factor [Bacteroidia bacterium]